MSKYKKFNRVGDGSKTIERAFNEFIKEKETLNKSNSTIRNYLLGYKKFITYAENTLDITPESSLDSINKFCIIDWVENMQNTVPSANSINHYLRDMRAFLYWCMDREYIRKPFTIREISKQESEFKMFTDKEIQALLKKPTKKDSFSTWRMWAMVNWALATGNRQSTICSIRLDDIDFDSKQIFLRHTKTKKRQYTVLSSSLEKVLKDYMNQYDISEEEYLFPTTTIGASYLTPDAMRLCFRKYCHNRGVARTNFHGLRHNFAKQWLLNKGDIASLQAMMGHSDCTMTMRYVALFGSDLVEAAEQFNPLQYYVKETGIKANLKKRA